MIISRIFIILISLHLVLTIKSSSDSTTLFSAGQIAGRVLTKTLSDDESEDDSHKLTAHPFFTNKEEEEEQKKSESKSKTVEKEKNINTGEQKKEEGSKQLGGQWHVYFIAMIVGTLVGMKMLSIQEQKVKYRNNHLQNSQLSAPEENSAEGAFESQN